jgi:hypothetical protein
LNRPDALSLGRSIELKWQLVRTTIAAIVFERTLLSEIIQRLKPIIAVGDI